MHCISACMAYTRLRCHTCAQAQACSGTHHMNPLPTVNSSRAWPGTLKRPSPSVSTHQTLDLWS